jgi:predicted esterase
VSTPAGWYPQSDSQQRYWDGEQWTQDFAPGVPPIARPATDNSDSDSRSDRNMHSRLRPVRLGLLAAIALGLTGMVATAPPSPALTTMPPCAASFIGVPGSGQNTSSRDMMAIQTTVLNKATAAGQQLRNSSVLPYMAVPWYRYLSGRYIVIPWNTLGVSEAQGQSNLKTRINQYRAANDDAGCSDAPLLLAGYSQGAEVVIRTVDAFPASIRATISVALVGNPSFTPSILGDLNLNTIRGLQGIRPSFIRQKYTLAQDVLKRTIDICAASDPICAYHLSVLPALASGTSAHYHYTSLTFKGSTLTTVGGSSLWAHRHIGHPLDSGHSALVP